MIYSAHAIFALGGSKNTVQFPSDHEIVESILFQINRRLPM